ncbi:MAG: diguanylate cyclase [Nocardioidaceae bacterium]|nr:diguanylate cyclase [Nocardioidaceae bacterium]
MWELQRSERATVWTLCILLVLSVASSAYLILVSQVRVVELTEMTQQSRLSNAAMLDQETSLRGWLATRDPQFLQPYREGAREWDAASGALLESLVRPDVNENIVTMLLTHQEWEEWATQARAMKASPADRSSGRLSAFLLEGKELFDDYRSAQEPTTEYFSAQRDDAITDQRNALILVMVATLGLLLVAASLALQRGRRLRRTVTAPLDRLSTTIGSLRSGDLSARTSASGVVELDSIGAALGDLATELQAAGDEAVAREARLLRLATRFETVVRVGREISASLSTRYVSESVTAAAADLLGAPATLWVRDDTGIFRATRRSDDPRGAVPPSTLVASTLVGDVAADARSAVSGPTRAYPMVLAGRVIGVLEANVDDVDADAEQVLEALMATAAAALESARLHGSIRELADIDPLTQLSNRRRLESDMETEWDRSRRYGRPMSFVMLDLDHFKMLNDEYGHLVGDTVLRAAATAVNGVLRSSDTAYRYGGEEIALILRETGPDDAAIVAERLRAAVASLTVDGTAATVTASLGVASASDDMAHQTELVSCADAALYDAKSGGRNRVMHWSAPVATVAG